MHDELSEPNITYVSTACVRGKHATLEDLVSDYIAAGILGIELGMCPSAASQDLGAFLRASGAELLIHNYFPAPEKPFVVNLASDVNDIRDRSIALAEDAIELAAAIEAPFYSVHSGFRVDIPLSELGESLSRRTVQPYERSYERFRSAIQWLASKAGAADIELLIEPNVVEQRNLIDGRNDVLLMATASELKSLLADVSEPLGILVDTGHLKVTAQTLGFDKDVFVNEVASYIRAFHLHDNDGLRDRHEPAADESWPLQLIMESRFLHLPIIVEATFSSTVQAAVYARNITAKRTGKNER